MYFRKDLHQRLRLWQQGGEYSKLFILQYTVDERRDNLNLDLLLLLLDGGWTTKSPADGNKSLSLPKSICSQEVVSSCLGKDLSAWRRSTISGTDYSGRDHITVKYCFWKTRLFKKHSYSVSELPDGL